MRRRALEAHHEVVGVAHDRDPTARIPTAPLMDPEIEDVVQEDVGQERTDHPSNNLAKLPFDPSVRVPRTQLRPHYGDGFDGAPLTVRRPRGEGRAGGGGADDPARSANPASAGAGES